LDLVSEAKKKKEKIKRIKLMYKEEMTEDQLEWIDMIKLIRAAEPDYEAVTYPKMRCRRKVHDLVSTNAF